MKDTWENFYKSRGRFYLLPHPNFDKVVAKLKTYRLNKVLDLGCGSGRHSIELAKQSFRVTGIDFAKEAIRLARQWAKSEKLKVTLITANIHKKISLKDNSFDAAIAVDAIHYSNSEALGKSLDEMKRVTRPGGLVFVTIPTTAGNPLVSHLIFTKDEILNMMKERFKILDSFTDKRKFLCVFGIVQKT
ncbi:MAG: class I SAM-dependent methyltransferase [Patescibacteria group bacterium]|nr:class I SAM-dependent methyltransferase [Patescibacteria group bacterium]